MWPLTCGAMPTKLARTVASSVWGRVSHCSNATTTATAAPAMIAPPIRRPTRRRTGESSGPTGAVIALHPEERHPEDQGDEDHEARVDERAWPEVGIDTRAKEQPSRDHRDTDPDRDAQHP